MKPTDELPVIFADAIQSLNYDGPDGAEVFADAGTLIDLDTGSITSTGIVVDGTTGDLSIRGEVEATAFVLDYSGTDALRLGSYNDGFNTLPALEALTAAGAVHTRLAWSTASIFGDTDQTGFLIVQPGLPLASIPNGIEVVSDDSYAVGGGDRQYLSLGNTGGSLRIEYASSASGLNRIDLQSNAIGGIVNIYAGQSGSLDLTAGTNALPGTIELMTTGLTADVTLDSLGDLTVANDLKVTGQVFVSNGSAANPSIRFTSDANSGLYWIGADAVGLAAGGGLRLRVDTAGIDVTGTIDATGAIRSDSDGLFDDEVYARASDSRSVKLGLWSGSTSWRCVEGENGYVLLAHSTGASHMYVRTSSASDNLYLGTNGTNRLTIQASDGYVVFAVNAASTTMPGTAGGVTMRWHSFGIYYQFTSNRWRKDRIEPVDLDRAGELVDALQPVTFIERYLGDEPEPEPARAWREADVFYGFIAEDVAEVEPHLAVVDAGESAETGDIAVKSWDEPAMIALAVAELKSLRARVAALESQA